MASERNAINLAQHFTPAPVADFVWAAMRRIAGRDLAVGSKIVDPAAGEGALLAAVDRGYETVGIEIDAELVVQGRRVAGQFHTGDGLLGAFAGVKEGGFDCVLANPPYGKLKDIYTTLDEDGQTAIAQRFSLFWSVARKRVATFPIELLFIERALQMVRPLGWLALILPEGLFANARLQPARDAVLKQAEVRAVVTLPGEVFRRKGLNARTALVILRRKQMGRAVQSKAKLIAPIDDGQDLDKYLQQALRLLQGTKREPGALQESVRQSQLAGCRWDPRFWQGGKIVRELAGRVRLASLGDYIRHLTYGPIITGQRPGHVEAGTPVIRQGNIVETGLDEGDLLRVEAEGEHDPERSRVCPGDLLLPRSGTGALGKNRLAVYLGLGPANVGCFVDLIRFEGLNPFYAWFFFKSRPGREQIAAMANGVGTPNISFAEIRSLKIPELSADYQGEFERRYRREVWPLHKRRRENAEICAEGERRFRGIVGDLERYLGGDKGPLVSAARPS